MKILLPLFLSIYFSNTQAQISHDDFDLLLKTHVNSEGSVNYKALKSDSVKLNAYITYLGQNAPQSDWTKHQQLTYWINAYNAVTLQLVLKYYPINSIKDIGSSIQIPYINTPWDIDCFDVAGDVLSLNNIEHDKIRGQFYEPRIHFALVCAAVSCPNLRNEAYQVATLEAQLTDQTRLFLADESKNMISQKRLSLSKLFSWYGGDFRKNGNIAEFVNPYTDVAVDKKAKISFMDYNWSLNEQ